MSDEAHAEKKEVAAHASSGHSGGGHGHGGGHEEAHEGAPEWLISFADNVALLMGFFVILLAMNMGPKANPVQGAGKGDGGAPENAAAMDAILSIRDGFNSPLNADDPNDQELIRYRLWKSGQGEAAGITGSHKEVQAIKPSDFHRDTASIAFDERSAVLSPTGRQTLVEVATKLRDQRWIIDIRGHVSPFESMRDNVKAMNLSHERAMVVASALVEAGLKWENLRIVACGSNDRLVARSFDRDADRSNQRVELVITNEPLPADPYSQDKSAGADTANSEDAKGAAAPETAKKEADEPK